VAFSGADQDGAIPRDTKFEGMSNLKNKSDKQKATSAKKASAQESTQIELDLIKNLQEQVARYELQIKLLKDREVDQKNKVSGYETLLRDNIPLNEHFLALKNKYNNEKDHLDKQLKAQEDDNKREEHSNKTKLERVENLRKEHENHTKRLNDLKELKTKEIKK
jgi:hypothetical protein